MAFSAVRAPQRRKVDRGGGSTPSSELIGPGVEPGDPGQRLTGQVIGEPGILAAPDRRAAGLQTQIGAAGEERIGLTEFGPSANW
jgi:hypothetical protein